MQVQPNKIDPFTFTITDLREVSLYKIDPDQVEGFGSWIRTFLTDLSLRYSSLGVKVDIDLKLTMRDK